MSKLVRCDLHAHTKDDSDGDLYALEWCRHAKELGIEAIAKTDHDNFSHNSEVVQLGKQMGLTVIPGVELTADGPGQYHILGYFFDENNPELQEFIRKQLESRNSRTEQILRFLNKRGANITEEDVREFSGDKAPAKPHFASALAKAGYVPTPQDAYPKYFNIPEYDKEVVRFKPSPVECVRVIKQAGGKVSWAHPPQTKQSPEWIEEQLKVLISEGGLDAIEVAYTQYTPQEYKMCRHLAEKYGLYMTGGSDYHGSKTKPGLEMENNLYLELDWLYN